MLGHAGATSRSGGTAPIWSRGVRADAARLSLGSDRVNAQRTAEGSRHPGLRRPNSGGGLGSHARAESPRRQVPQLIERSTMPGPPTTAKRPEVNSCPRGIKGLGRKWSPVLLFHPLHRVRRGGALQPVLSDGRPALFRSSPAAAGRSSHRPRDSLDWPGRAATPIWGFLARRHPPPPGRCWPGFRARAAPRLLDNFFGGA